MVRYMVEYLKKCPALSGRVPAADFLAKEEGSVGVFAVAAHPVIMKYADGGCLKQFVFRISFREKSFDPEQDHSESLCSQVERWVRRESAVPDVGPDAEAQYVEVVKTGTVTDRSYGSQRYDMECRLIYYLQKGE